MSTLEEFLRSHLTDDKATATHIGMGAARPHSGKYVIHDHEYPKLLSLIERWHFNDKKQFNLLECHRNVGPVLIDLDFRYLISLEGVKGPKAKESLCKRRYTQDMINNFIGGYAAILEKYYNMSDIKSMTFYIMEKTKPLIDDKNSLLKDGIHIVIADLITTPEIQYALRKAVLDANLIEESFAGTEIYNSSSDIFDKRVIKSNNWFMYGGSKPNLEPYLLTRRVVLEDGALTEYEDKPPSSLDLLQILSIRYKKVETPLTVNADTSEEWTEIMNEANGVKLKKIPAVPKALAEDPADEPDTGVETGDSAKSILDPYENAAELETVMKLAVECLADERANDYSQWMDVGFCLHNLCAERLFDTWVKFSQRSPKFDDEAYNHMRREWPRMTNRGLKMGSLHMWAKTDNPHKYREIMEADLINAILKTPECSHVAVANIASKLYCHQYCCADFDKKPWYEFRSHRWVKLSGGIDLRRKLSDEIRRLYIEAHKRVLDRKKDAGGKDLEILEKMEKSISETTKKLGDSVFKDRVMKECCEPFFREEFNREINANPYLVVCANGVLELRAKKLAKGRETTGVNFRPGHPDDMMTNCTKASYHKYNPKDPTTCEILGFFAKLFPKEAVREYMLTLLSSCLEGSNREQKFYILTGVGSNGKSILVRLMNKTLYEYTGSLSTTSLTRKRPESGAANPDIMGIKGKRFISMQEPDGRESLNFARVKQFSGEDDITCRPLYGDIETITIMGKIFLCCNDMPTIPTTDWGTWRRIRVIKLISRFCKDPSSDPELHEFLVDESFGDKLDDWPDAFLSILVHYYETKYLKHGLREPPEVLEESRKYQEENDLFAVFLKDCNEPAAGSVLSFSRTWDRYGIWIKEQPEKIKKMRQIEFKQRMKIMYGDPGTEGYRGIRICGGGGEPVLAVIDEEITV